MFPGDPRLTPADIKPVRLAVAIVWKPRHWPQVKVPVQVLGHRLTRFEAFGPKDAAPVPVGIDGLEFADAAAADKFAGHAEFASILAPLLCAGLINPAKIGRA